MMRIAPPLSANDVNYYISCHSKLGSSPVVMLANIEVVHDGCS